MSHSPDSSLLLRFAPEGTHACASCPSVRSLVFTLCDVFLCVAVRSCHSSLQPLFHQSCAHANSAGRSSGLWAPPEREREEEESEEERG